MQRTINILSEEKWLEIKDAGQVKHYNEEPYLIIEKDV